MSAQLFDPTRSPLRIMCTRVHGESRWTHLAHLDQKDMTVGTAEGQKPQSSPVCSGGITQTSGLILCLDNPLGDQSLSKILTSPSVAYRQLGLTNE